VNRTYMSKLEKAASYPGLEIIAKFATLLEVEPAELLRGAAGNARTHALPLTIELAFSRTGSSASAAPCRSAGRAA
jgi:hypothetical protein